MRKLSIAAYLCVASCLGFNSCNLLDVPQENIITNDSFWKNPGDAKAFLTGIYNRMLANQNGSLWGEDRGDSFKAGEIGPTSNAWAHALLETNAPSYRDSYYIIHNVNLLFSRIEKLNFTNEAERKQIKAEAYAIRAYAYYHMLKIWGGVPIVTEPTLSDAVINKARSSKEEVMQVVLADIESALGLFTKEGYVNKHYFSKPAVLALKADVLMWKAKVHGGGATDLNTAIECINAVEASGVSLLPVYADVFANGNKKNNEIIFSMYINRYETESLSIAANTTSRTDNVSSADNISEAATSPNKSRHVYAPSEKVRALYDMNPSDIRKKSAIIDLVQGETLLLTQQNKFRGKDYGDDRFFDDDLIIYRWGDMVLLRAEANAALGNMQEAVADLNQIRNRAGLDDYEGAMDKQSVEKEICNERLRELFIEQKRWFDLVRFHSGGTIDIYQEVPNLKDKPNYPLYWPINYNDMVSNEMLVQTEGYASSFSR